MSLSRQAGMFLLLLVLAVLTRLPAFTRSVLDWDESLYFLMASAWRAGHLPYTTIWDNKPVGIYAIFAVFQAVFGAGIVAMRIATLVFVALGAWAVVNITHALAAPGRSAWWGAVFAGLVFLLASLSNDGLAANTELFMACFTALAIVTAVSPRRAGWPLAQGLLTGLALGAAFMVKYVAVFEAPAVICLLLVPYRRQPARAAGVAGAAMLGAALPLGATILLYVHAGLLGLWWDSAIVANLRRLAPQVPHGAFAAAWHLQSWRWGSLYAAAVVMLAVAGRAFFAAVRGRRWPDAACWFLPFWLAGGCLGVAAAKSFYDHYFLQLLPVLCVGCGWLLAKLAAGLPRAAVFAALLVPPAGAAYTALAAALQPVLIIQAGGWHLQDDAPARIAAAINQEPSVGLKLYVFDGQPIIYALTGQPPPTRYVLPSVLTRNLLRQVANVDATAEVTAILARQPEFIVRVRQPPANPKTINQGAYVALDAALSGHYRLWRSEGDMDVYRQEAVLFLQKKNQKNSY